MAIPKNGSQTQCQPSTLYRTFEDAIFTDEDLGFSLTDVQLKETFDNFQIDSNLRELYFSDVERLEQGKRYFWKLPARFLGNKLSSYGGYLSFTPSISSSNQLQIILSGNGIQLMHKFSPNGKQIRVFIHESR